MPPHHVLLDTSFIIALENRDDPFHDRAVALIRELSRLNAILVTHWGILLEIGDGYARIDRREKGLVLLEKMQQSRDFCLVPLSEPLLQQAIAFYGLHRDKNWGLTDCVSFALMRQEHIADALTADAHFRQAGFNALLLDEN